MSRRVLAQMVVRNEADRYLEAVLAALGPHVDAVHVYDDLSHDETVKVALDAGAVVTRRPPLIPSFATDESLFRQAAWEAMENELRPTSEDWILAIDADELLVAPQGLGPAIEAAEDAGACAVVVPIPEAFGLVERGARRWQPLVRIDGFWGNLAQPRLLAYQYEGRFVPRHLAGGSVPSYVSAGAQYTANHGVELLHLGYLEMADRHAKYARYAGVPGHSAAHVASILATPFLRPWHGVVELWRRG